MTDNTNAQSITNTFSYADFINMQKEHKQKVTKYLSNKKREVLKQVYDEIKREPALPETIYIRNFTPYLSILHSSDNPEVYTFCSEIAEMLQQNGFKYKASTQSQVNSSATFECAFKKKSAIWPF